MLRLQFKRQSRLLDDESATMNWLPSTRSLLAPLQIVRALGVSFDLSLYENPGQ